MLILVKKLLYGFAGIFLALIGFFLVFLFIQALPKGQHLWLLLAVGGVFIVSGLIVLLIMTRKVSQAINQQPITQPQPVHESFMEKQQRLIGEWNKTYEQKEKLKMLKFAAGAAEQDQQGHS